jgi:hypothetical protein
VTVRVDPRLVEIVVSDGKRRPRRVVRDYRHSTSRTISSTKRESRASPLRTVRLRFFLAHGGGSAEPTAISLMEEMSSPARSTISDVAEPTPDHQRLLKAIWTSFRHEHQWPKFVGIDQILDREGLGARQLIATMPAGLMVPDVQAMSHLYSPNASDELRVKVPALQFCDDTEAELALLARLVRYIADRERAFVLPSLSEPTPLIVTSDEARRDLGLVDEEVARAWALLSTFETRMWGGGGNPEAWSLQIDIEEARRYRGVDSPESYVAARADLDHPQRPVHSHLPTDEGREMAEMLSPSATPAPAVPQPVARRQRTRALAPVLSHPIVSGVIVGVILLVFGVLFGR